MARDKERWNAYMRDYRRRKRDGLPTIRKQAQAVNHQACDAQIAKLQYRIKQLEGELADARALLPF